MNRDYEMKQAAEKYSAACNAGAAIGQNRPASLDPVSMREQHQALMQLLDRLSGQRGCLSDIADFIFGSEPESPPRATQAMPPVGGMTAEIVTTFQRLATVLDEIDNHIRRLQRVSS
jgi:hypothetical protein